MRMKDMMIRKFLIAACLENLPIATAVVKKAEDES